MPPQSKVRCQDSDALRFACAIHASNNQLSFAGKEGQEDSSGHGKEVPDPCCGQAGREVPLWRDRHPRLAASDVFSRGNEPPDEPACSFSEGRIGKIMWHGQRKVSHIPAHGQPCR